MISLMPEYAPPTPDTDLRLYIADHCTFKFSEDQATEYIQQASDEIIHTLTSLFTPLVSTENLHKLIDMELLMEQVRVTQSDGVTMNMHFTNMLHNLILHRVNKLI